MNSEERGLVAKSIQMAVRKVLEQSDDEELVEMLGVLTQPLKRAVQRERYKGAEEAQRGIGSEMAMSQRSVGSKLQDEIRASLNQGR